MKFVPRKLKGNANVSKVSPMKELFTLLGGILVVLIAVYLTLGLLVEVLIFKMPVKLEKKLNGFFSSSFKEDNLSTEQERLNIILDKLLAKSNFPKEEYKVFVIEDERVNALAFPGGNIVVFSGLLKKIDSENEIAFVLAHEMGHFANRDHLRGFGRRLVLLSMSLIFFGENSSATHFLMNSLMGMEMRFSQKQEILADEFALELLNAAYGNVSGAADFFAKMNEEEKIPKFIYFFATHPHPEKRLELLKEKIANKGYRVNKQIEYN